jgi:hypothetical protein
MVVWRRFGLLATMVLFTLMGCAYRQRLAVETASNWFKCPQAQVSATDLGENRYAVAGCGKRDVFYCDYVTEKEYTAAQHSELLCQPIKQAIENSERNRRIADACSDACLEGAVACSGRCESLACRNACDTIAQGCVDGCISSQH